MKIGDVTDKRVISVAEAAFRGKICGVFVKKQSHTVKFLATREEFLDNAVLRHIPFTKILHIGDDALTVINGLCIKGDDCADVSDCIFIKIGLPVYNDDGNFLGTLNEVDIEDASGRVAAYIVGGNGFAPDEVASASADMLIIGKRRLPPRSPKRIKKPKADYAVKALSVELPPTVEVAAVGISDAFAGGGELTADYHVPARLISDYSFLLGRLIIADIFSYGGEPIVKRGETVTTDTVERARRYGKLAELTLNSKE